MTQREPKKLAVDKLSFEDAIGELEQLVEQIESGEVGLEAALKQYERGTSLIKRCRHVLAAAEHRITELTASSDGELLVNGEAEGEENGEVVHERRMSNDQ